MQLEKENSSHVAHWLYHQQQLSVFPKAENMTGGKKEKNNTKNIGEDTWRAQRLLLGLEKSFLWVLSAFLNLFI